MRVISHLNPAQDDTIPLKTISSGFISVTLTNSLELAAKTQSSQERTQTVI